MTYNTLHTYHLPNHLVLQVRKVWAPDEPPYFAVRSLDVEGFIQELEERLFSTYAEAVEYARLRLSEAHGSEN